MRTDDLARSPMGRAARVLRVFMLAVVAAAFGAPLLWMVGASLKPEDQATSSSLGVLPDPASSAFRHARENYGAVWRDDVVDFPLYLRNSLIVCSLSVVGMTASSAVVAYGMARIRFRGRGALLGLMIATMMVPVPVLIAPMYLLFRELGWIGTFRPLWVPAFFANAFNVFMLRQFMASLPRELEEAASIDGCSRLRSFATIVVPLCRPALATVAVLHFVWVWNDFLGPLVFLTHRDQFTAALGLHLFQSQAGNTPWNLLMAASTLVVAPVLAVFLLAQRGITDVMTVQGMKE